MPLFAGLSIFKRALEYGFRMFEGKPSGYGVRETFLGLYFLVESSPSAGQETQQLGHRGSLGLLKCTAIFEGGL